MSYLAYPDNSPTNSITPPSGWEILTQSDELSNFKGGYFGVAFWNRNTNQIIVAHKGTQNNSIDLFNDFQIVVKDTPSEFYSAIYFMNKVKQKAAEQGIRNPEYYNTGHSLGALLAELVGATFQTPVIDFESPGGYDYIKDFQKNALTFAQANTFTYNARPNAINTWNSHVGSTYEVDPLLSIENKNTDEFGTPVFRSYVDFTKQQHAIDGIVSLCSAEGDWLDSPKLITKWP